jgi:hypothetical protein
LRVQSGRKRGNPLRRKLSLFLPLISLLLLFLNFSAPPAAAQAWSGLLEPVSSCNFLGSPASCAVDWSQVGVGGIPARSTTCATISASTYSNGSSDASSGIQSALNSCASGDTVLLGAGTFLINSHVTVPANVTLRGAGANQTVLNGKGSGSAPVVLGGGSVAYSGAISISSGATAGSTSLGLSSASGISVGSYLVVSETNNSAFVTIGGTEGSCTWCDGWSTSGQRARGQIVEVESISGNTVTIAPGLYGAYTNSPTVVPFKAAAKYAGVEDLQIYANNTGYTNQAYLDECAYCWVKGVEFNYSDGNPIEVDWGYRDEIRDSYISNAYTHEPGSTDSDIFLVLKTSASLVENNILERQHVGIILNWGAAGNVVAYNYSQGNFDASATNVLMSGFLHHGAHPEFNLWEGNVGEQLYLDSVWGSSSHDTSFRGWYKGTSNICTPLSGRGTVTSSCHYANQAARAVQVSELSHYDNFIGDVIGATETNSISSSRTSILVSPSNRGYDGAVYGFTFGYGEASDSSGAGNSSYTTALIHGMYSDYDGSTTWASSLSHSLPPSFYLSGQPAWWGSAVPFPANGPDVSGGSGPGGHAYGNPAMNCYTKTMGGVDGGIGGPMSFNASSCYGSSSGSSSGSSQPPSPPTNLSVTVQ